MNRRHLLRFLAAAPLWAGGPARAAADVHVYKLASCDCCAKWVEHLKTAGFSVRVTTTDDTIAVRKRLGMPDAYGACHTATVAGYVIEGHVPATEMRRLLAARPAAIGLAVPSMPVGSPGMEYGDRRDPYEVFLIDRQGRASVFATYPKPSAASMAAPATASAPPPAGSPALTRGVVTAVDRSRGFVTLNHEEIVNMAMPPMTMGFNVAEKKLLDHIKTGDKVRFRVETVQGSPTVTRIEAVR